MILYSDDVSIKNHSEFLYSVYKSTPSTVVIKFFLNIRLSALKFNRK